MAHDLLFVIVGVEASLQLVEDKCSFDTHLYIVRHELVSGEKNQILLWQHTACEQDPGHCDTGCCLFSFMVDK